MNPDQLLGHFARISETPDAIPRLRRFIFELAVRGKLVAQVYSDEPASGLMNRIAVQKAGSTKDGRSRPEQPPNSVKEEEILFEIPNNWQWVHAAELCSCVVSGSTPAQEVFHPCLGVPFLKVYNIRDQKVDFEYKKQFIDPGYHSSKSKRSVLHPGDVIMNIVGPPLGKVAIIPPDYPEWNCNQAITAFRPAIRELAKYIYTFFREGSFLKNIELIGTAGQDNISVTKCRNIAIPLPPLAEQHRIVAKVDELMALCDRLEAAQKEREGRRDRLARASLHCLNQPADAGNAQAFRHHARFTIDHLPRLTARPEDILSLRHVILSLAFQGRLADQSLPVEPCSESAPDHLTSLLRTRTQKWMERYANRSAGKCPAPVAHKSANLPLIPVSWVWTSADAVCSQITDGEHIQPRYQPDGLPMLSAKHIRDGYVTMKDAPLIAETDFQKARHRCAPGNGDILVVSVGATTGRAAIARDCPPFVIVRSVLLLKPILGAEYFLRWLQSPWCFTWMIHASGATAQPHLYIRDIKEMPVPVPPLAEQHRIVAKVDQLMGLCERLEGQLTTGQTEGRRLLEAVLYEALATQDSDVAKRNWTEG